MVGGAVLTDVRGKPPWRAVPKLIVASGAVLLGCPQLATDEFETLLTGPVGQGGSPPPICAEDCVGGGGATASPPEAGGAGGAPEGGGTGGASSSGGSDSGGTAGDGTGGTATPSNGGAGGSTSQGGTGGTAAGSGGASGAGGGTTTEPVPCRTFNLTATTQDGASNCVGVYGWNDIETDPESSTLVDLSYSDGQACFTGTIDSEGWGAVYNLTFANTSPWNAEAQQVTGFEVTTSGAELPPSLQIKYSSTSGDFCTTITPGTAVEVPFDGAQPCSGSATVPDASGLTFLRVIFPVPSSYAIDFCLGLRALP